MASDLTSGEARVAERERTVVRAPRARRRESYRSRFLVAYLVLALVGAAAAAGGYVLLSEGGREPEAAWSAWQPEGDESSFPEQIANYVARRYVLPSGNQIVGIVAGAPTVTGPADSPDLKVSHVAIVEENADSEEEIQVFEVGDGVMYRFCGLGENCAIREGEASEERHRLLRREALELALYTFKWADAESVIALLPPPPETESNGTAVFFRKSDFREQLAQPLAQTLAQPNPPARDVVLQVGPAERILVDRLTRPRLFRFDYRLAPDGNGVVLLLAPITG